MLHRRLKFSGGTRVKFHTSIKFHFRSQTEVKRKTQLHAPLDALHKIALLRKDRLPRACSRGGFEIIIPHGRRPNKILNADLLNLFICRSTRP